MTTVTCLVCGAAEEPGSDHTCPVCGADLPPAPAEAPPATDAETTDAETTDAEMTGSAATGPAAPPPPPAADPATPPPPPPAGGVVTVPARPSPHDPTHPSGLSSSVRTHAMLTHLSAFAGALVALAFVGPLVMWLIRRDEHPFLDHHGKEALNFNLSMLLYVVVGLVVTIATVGIGLIVVLPAAAVLLVTWIVTTIIGAVTANAGEGYRYPLSIRFIGEDV